MGLHWSSHIVSLAPAGLWPFSNRNPRLKPCMCMWLASCIRSGTERGVYAAFAWRSPKNIYDQELPLEHALCCEQLGKRNDAVQAGEGCPNDLTLPSQPAAS